MTPAFRVKLALVAIVSLLATTFAWNAAQGQNWPQQPPNRGGSNIFTCPNCGFMYRGTVPPAVCPACKAHIGGGVGDAGGDAPVGLPPFRFSPPPKDGEAPLRTNTSPGFFKSSTAKVVVIAVVVGAVVLGAAVLAGGAFLVIYNMRNKNSAPERRRRPRRRNDDDYDD